MGASVKLGGRLTVSAIVVPGGPGDRLDAALNLARHDRATYLVLSEGDYIPPELCGSRVGTATVLCFQPDPTTTQGEAEATARLARQYGFHGFEIQPRLGRLRSAAKSLLCGEKAAGIALRPGLASHTVGFGIFEHGSGISVRER